MPIINLKTEMNKNPLTQCCTKFPVTDPAGTLEKALERNLLEVEYDRSLPLLDLAFGEVPVCLSNSNKTRIPRRWKCSRRVLPFQR